MQSEDKRLVLKNLEKTLMSTREYDDLRSLDYSGILASGDEYVTATFQNSKGVIVDITGDSGIALIYDVLRVLGGWSVT